MPDPGDAAPSPGRAGPDAADTDPSFARVARQIVRDGARIVGFLALSRRRRPVNLTELLTRLSQSLTAFVDGDVALIPSWTEWTRVPGAPEGDAGPRMTVREIQPRVVEVVPAPVTDALSAEQALERTLQVLSEDYAHVLVNLQGYAPPGGRAPSTVALVEAVALVVTRRSAHVKDVDVLIKDIPASKQLGAVLLD